MGAGILQGVHGIILEGFGQFRASRCKRIDLYEELYIFLFAYVGGVQMSARIRLGV